MQSNDLESELLLLFLRNLSDTCRLRFLTNGLKLPFNSEGLEGGILIPVPSEKNLENPSPGVHFWKNPSIRSFIDVG